MNIEIANRLVELRRANGYSQESLAAALGVSRQAVSKWERAESAPDTDNLISLARLYRISLDGLLLNGAGETGDAGAAAQAAPESETEADEAERIFAAAAAWDAADEAAAKQRRRGLKRTLKHFPYAIVITILYLALGFTAGWWHPGWMLYLTIPIYYCIVGAL